MGSEDQSLTVQSKKTRTSHHRGKHSHQRSNFRKPRDMSKYIFYTCNERDFARDSARNKSNSHKNKGNKRRHHAHAAKDDEPSTKRIRQESDEEYVLISALMGTISH